MDPFAEKRSFDFGKSRTPSVMMFYLPPRSFFLSLPGPEGRRITILRSPFVNFFRKGRVCAMLSEATKFFSFDHFILISLIPTSHYRRFFTRSPRQVWRGVSFTVLGTLIGTQLCSPATEYDVVLLEGFLGRFLSATSSFHCPSCISPLSRQMFCGESLSVTLF